jgi:hypothetical protein
MPPTRFGQRTRSAGWFAGLLSLVAVLAGCTGPGDAPPTAEQQFQAAAADRNAEPLTEPFPRPGGAALIALPPCVPSGRGTDYAVGPGQALASLDQVPWEQLQAGDTVRLYPSAQPYRGKFLVAAQGTAAAPVRICGVRGADGQRPVIDGRDATTRPALAAAFAGSASDIFQARAIVMIKARSSDAWGDAPAHVQIDGLKLTGVHPTYTFRDAAGAARSYEQFGACVWIDRGNAITIADNEITDCPIGVFSRSTDDGPAAVTRDLRLAGNVIHGNGIAGSDREHNTYTQGIGVVIEHNVYGPLRDGALGNAIKDRSAGLVVRYNRIEEGAHALDLVEAEDFPLAALATPAYRVTTVHGNQIRKRGDTGSVIHYGGDHYGSWPGARWGEPIYRKGTLQFFSNTVMVTGEQAAIFQLSTTEEVAEVRNNVFVFASTVTQRSLRMDQTVVSPWVGGGVLRLGRNWLSADWQDTDPWHPVGGTLAVTAPQVVGALSPLERGGWRPLAGSGVVDAAVAGDGAEDWQLDASGVSRVRATAGAGPDLGAVER